MPVGAAVPVLVDEPVPVGEPVPVPVPEGFAVDEVGQGVEVWEDLVGRHLL